MQELNSMEIEQVAGGDFDGMLWGMAQGAATGLAMAKWATGGGILFGAIAQLVGIFAGPIGGAIVGGGIGLLSDRATVDQIASEFRQTFGPGTPNTGSLI